jgi:hypothetical protein
MFERFWRRGQGKSPAEDANQANRRAHPRYPTDLETECELVNGTVPKIQVCVRNVSRGGINFLTDHRMEPGTLLRIDLPNNGPASNASVLACVMHASIQTDGKFSVGCAFSDELGDAQLEVFGARKEAPDVLDKRAWKRFDSQGVAEYILLPPIGEPAKHAQIVNLSPTGIGLLLEEKIEAGAILDLVLKSNDEKQPTFDILACVVFVGARDEGGWVVGCHFIRELAEADLKRLM